MPSWAGLGCVLAIVGFCMPMCCCILPHAVFYFDHGRGPIDGESHKRIKDGMTSQQVVDILGTPHSIQGDSWIYWDGAIAGTWHLVQFKGDIVIHTAIE